MVTKKLIVVPFIILHPRENKFKIYVEGWELFANKVLDGRGKNQQIIGV
jgi:hypothetical protein